MRNKKEVHLKTFNEVRNVMDVAKLIIACFLYEDNKEGFFL